MSPNVTPRSVLADVADRVIAQMDGVALSDRGRLGISAVAQTGGRYELGLRVAVAWPPEPLHGLAEEIRRRIGAAAAADTDLAGALGDINVAIVDVADLDSRRTVAS